MINNLCKIFQFSIDILCNFPYNKIKEVIIKKCSNSSNNYNKKFKIDREGKI